MRAGTVGFHQGLYPQHLEQPLTHGNHHVVNTLVNDRAVSQKTDTGHVPSIIHSTACPASGGKGRIYHLPSGLRSLTVPDSCVLPSVFAIDRLSGGRPLPVNCCLPGLACPAGPPRLASRAGWAVEMQNSSDRMWISPWQTPRAT